MNKITVFCVCYYILHTCNQKLVHPSEEMILRHHPLCTRNMDTSTFNYIGNLVIIAHPGHIINNGLTNRLFVNQPITNRS